MHEQDLHRLISARCANNRSRLRYCVAVGSTGDVERLLRRPRLRADAVIKVESSPFWTGICISASVAGALCLMFGFLKTLSGMSAAETSPEGDSTSEEDPIILLPEEEGPDDRHHLGRVEQNAEEASTSPPLAAHESASG